MGFLMVFVSIRIIVESVVRRPPKAFFPGGCPSLVGKHSLRRNSPFVHMTAESTNFPSVQLRENTSVVFHSVGALSRTAFARFTFSMITSAFAVHV